MFSHMLKSASIAFSLLILMGCSASSEEQNSVEKSEGSSLDAAEIQLEKDRAREGALGDMVIGNPDSDVTLIEYASFTCGHCANFHKSVYPEIKRKYIDTGKIRFVFRELPTPPQQLSYIGSVIARCASDRGGDEAYFAVADGLFHNQQEWVFGNDPLTELLKITNQAGMDEEAINTCLKRQEIVDVINANVKEGNERFGITGTPTFVMNGEKLKLSDHAEDDGHDH